jgi:hypothetical protein
MTTEFTCLAWTGILTLLIRVPWMFDKWTRAAAAVYFWARLVHFGAYAFGVPLVKTAAFVAAFSAQLLLAWQFVEHR